MCPQNLVVEKSMNASQEHSGFSMSDKSTRCSMSARVLDGTQY